MKASLPIEKARRTATGEIRAEPPKQFPLFKRSCLLLPYTASLYQIAYATMVMWHRYSMQVDAQTFQGFQFHNYLGTLGCTFRRLLSSILVRTTLSRRLHNSPGTLSSKIRTPVEDAYVVNHWRQSDLVRHNRCSSSACTPLGTQDFGSSSRRNPTLRIRRYSPDM
jgi:hypothetical protein